MKYTGTRPRLTHVKAESNKETGPNTSILEKLSI
jgi:hypothetical protein